MRTSPHAHPCARCKAKTECCATVEFNYDGSPEFWCVEYHGKDQRAEFLCEDCAALPDCDGFRGGEDCDGGKATEPRGNADGYVPPVMFCLGCANAYDRWRDNYEPPEPDGEAFRGGEAAAYQAEQMDEARRLK